MTSYTCGTRDPQVSFLTIFGLSARLLCEQRLQACTANLCDQQTPGTLVTRTRARRFVGAASPVTLVVVLVK